MYVEESLGLGFILFLYIIIYAAITVPMFILAKKANLDNAFWSFIPILNSLVLLDMIGERRLSILLIFIPFVNFIIAIYWMYKLFVVFGRPAILYLILYTFVPFASIAILYYMAFSSTVRYEGVK